MTRFKAICLVLLCVGACAGDGDDVDLSSRDPRCVTACTTPEPRYEGIGAVCDAASRVQCLDECEARIANVMPICQTCLVEDADFGTDGVSAGGYCTNNTCTLTSDFGSCTYTEGDQAAELRCRQQVDPRREVSCTARFRPTTECASVCN